MKFLLSLALLVAWLPLAGPAAARCSMIVAPINGFAESSYVFTGRVAGLAGPLTSKRPREVWGLLVDVDEVVHAPAPLGGRAEVFPFHLAPDCGDEPWDLKELMRYFPSGAKVRVIAFKSRSFAEPTTGGAVRLDSPPHHGGHLSLNEPDGSPMTSASTVYDYAAFVKPGAPWTQENAPALAARYSLPDFELQKDLLRLRRAGSEAERVQILERLTAYPGGRSLDFEAVARQFVKDARALSALLKTWDAALARQRPTP